jgi:hypothetical protein
LTKEFDIQEMEKNTIGLAGAIYSRIAIKDVK